MFTHKTLDMFKIATSTKHASGLILEKERCRLWELTLIGKTTTWYIFKDLNLSIFLRKAKQYLVRKQIYHLSLYNSSIFYFSQQAVRERVCVCVVYAFRCLYFKVKLNKSSVFPPFEAVISLLSIWFSLTIKYLNNFTVADPDLELRGE